MITYMLLLKRKKDITKEQFRAHYESSHVALAKKFFGHLFLDYRRHFPIETRDITGEESWFLKDDTAYDAITKVDFKDEADYKEFRRLCAQPDIKATLVADEMLFLDREKVRTYVCEQVKTWTSADIVKK